MENLEASTTPRSKSTVSALGDNNISRGLSRAAAAKNLARVAKQGNSRKKSVAAAAWAKWEPADCATLVTEATAYASSHGGYYPTEGGFKDLREDNYAPLLGLFDKYSDTQLKGKLCDLQVNGTLEKVPAQSVYTTDESAFLERLVAAAPKNDNGLKPGGWETVLKKFNARVNAHNAKPENRNNQRSTRTMYSLKYRHSFNKGTGGTKPEPRHVYTNKSRNANGSPNYWTIAELVALHRGLEEARRFTDEKFRGTRYENVNHDTDWALVRYLSGQTCRTTKAVKRKAQAMCKEHEKNETMMRAVEESSAAGGFETMTDDAIYTHCEEKLTQLFQQVAASSSSAASGSSSASSSSAAVYFCNMDADRIAIEPYSSLSGRRSPLVTDAGSRRPTACGIKNAKFRFHPMYESNNPWLINRYEAIADVVACDWARSGKFNFVLLNSGSSPGTCAPTYHALNDALELWREKEVVLDFSNINFVSGYLNDEKERARSAKVIYRMRKTFHVGVTYRMNGLNGSGMHLRTDSMAAGRAANNATAAASTTSTSTSTSSSTTTTTATASTATASSTASSTSTSSTSFTTARSRNATKLVNDDRFGSGDSLGGDSGGDVLRATRTRRQDRRGHVRRRNVVSSDDSDSGDDGNDKTMPSRATLPEAMLTKRGRSHSNEKAA